MTSKMTGKECAAAWKKVIQIYRDTLPKNRPDDTMRAIVNEIGYENAIYLFAVVAEIKSHDGRISQKSRSFLRSKANIDPELVKWDHSNPMIYAGLDDIHPAHIENLLQELRFL